MTITTKKTVDSRELTAFHEAGHAVASYSLKRRFSYVTIIHGEDFEGRMVGGSLPGGFEPDINVNCRERTWIENTVRILLAGPVAEQIRAGADAFSAGSDDDVDKANDLLDYMVGGPEEREAYLHLLHIRTRGMMQVPHRREQVEALAEALLKNNRLSYRKTGEVIRQALADKLSALRMPRLNPSILETGSADDATNSD